MNAYAIQPAQLRRMLDDGGEIALLDVREEGVFARDGHILLARLLGHDLDGAAGDILPEAA